MGKGWCRYTCDYCNSRYFKIIGGNEEIISGYSLATISDVKNSMTLLKTQIDNVGSEWAIVGLEDGYVSGAGYDYEIGSRVSDYGHKLIKRGINCKTTTIGKEYNGTMHVTKSGKNCLHWASVKHQQIGSLPENFCRNPDNGEGPWCYYDDAGEKPLWEYCEIPMCRDECNDRYKSCQDFAEKGNCSKSMFQEYVKIYCRKSCNLC